MREIIRTPETLIGQPAKEVVRMIVQDPRIKMFSLTRYNPGTTSEEDPDLFWKFERN